MTREEKEQTGKYVLQMARLLEDGCYQQEMLLKAVHIIDEALQQESFEDAVSRQSVKEQMIYYGFLAPDMTVTEFVEDCLQPVNPQKTGHWIDTGSGQECSECGEIQYGYDSFRYFCANCGAKMVEPQESEVRNEK